MEILEIYIFKRHFSGTKINGIDDEVEAENSFTKMFGDSCKPNSVTVFSENETEFVNENSILMTVLLGYAFVITSNH